MSSALCEDFAALGVDVLALGDCRLCSPVVKGAVCIESADDERQALATLAARADWTIIIAPESNNALVQRCDWVLQTGGRLLSPGLATVRLSSDKQVTAEHLIQRGIRVPPGMPLNFEPPLDQLNPAWFPAVIKPLDGCGSQGLRRIDRSAQLACFGPTNNVRLERFVPGLPASVAVLCGPSGLVPLRACEQVLSSDGRFTYLGGRTPLAEPLDQRARRLAMRAVSTLPDAFGYIGVDLVLGDDATGQDDHVIEINPRLTTSYVGLRAICRDNLAAAMLSVAEGREPALTWHTGAVEFSADGKVRHLDRTATARNDR
jgi:predicted ATP-grasp superfamily ATP-dependent carboligase